MHWLGFYHSFIGIYHMHMLFTVFKVISYPTRDFIDPTIILQGR